MRIFSLACFIVASAFGMAQPARDMPEGARLIQRCVNNMQAGKYKGTRVTTFSEGPNTTTVTEHITRQGPNMRLEFASNSPRYGEVIVIKGGNRSHFFPAANEIQVGRARPDEPLARILRFARPATGFKFEVGSGGTVANLATKLVTVKDPRGNIITKVWVSTNPPFALKRELFDPSGRNVGGYEFTAIDFNPRIALSDFEINRQGAKVVRTPDMVRSTNQRAGLPAMMLPESSGAYLDATRIIQGSARNAVMQSYSVPDGKISVFLSRDEFDQPRLRRLSGANMRFARGKHAGVNIVVLGDLDQNALNRYLNALTDVP